MPDMSKTLQVLSPPPRQENHGGEANDQSNAVFGKTITIDACLLGAAGMSVESAIPANIIIVKASNRLKKIWARSDEKRRETP